jgi:hypothetical protein
MNLQKIVRTMKEKIQTAPDRLALTILIWLENEPTQDRAVLRPLPGDGRGPYLRYPEKKNGGRRLSEKETAA